jgi:hypothetical protein
MAAILPISIYGRYVTRRGLRSVRANALIILAPQKDCLACFNVQS